MSYKQANGIHLEYTPVDSIEGLVNGVKKTFATGKMRNLKFRTDQIKQVGFLVQDNQEALGAALRQDLNRHPSESFLAEINTVIADCNDIVKHLPKWSKPESVKTDMTWFLTRPKVYKEPKGTVLIISPFNYPLTLSLVPLMGALAGGNTVVLKQSEQTPAVSSLLTRLIPKYLDPSVVITVNGAKDETARLLEIPFDHIFFTGSTNVGRIVAKAAGQNLCPVTLELGGKSPCVVFADADIKIAARRIAWGKQVNAAQTCIAPDYVLLPRALQPKFIEAYRDAIKDFYPRGDKPIDSDNFSSLVSSGAYARLAKALEETKGKVVIGGGTIKGQKRIDNTLVSDVSNDDVLMQMELFGPILPMMTCESKEDAVRLINQREIPLALYIFTNDKKKKDYVFERTRSGAVVWNDNMVHFIVPGLPFGGAGPAGYGNYHGKRSFDTFIHERAFMHVPFWMEPMLGIRYPPYTENRAKWYKALLGKKLTFSRPNQVGFLQTLIGRYGKLRLLALAVAALALLQRFRLRR